MTPKEEQAFRMKLMFAMSLAGSTAQMFTTRDPAAGLTIQFALSNVTGKYWDENKAFYESMKSGTKQAVAEAPVTFDKETVIKVLADMGINVA